MLQFNKNMRAAQSRLIINSSVTQVRVSMYSGTVPTRTQVRAYEGDLNTEITDAAMLAACDSIAAANSGQLLATYTLAAVATVDADKAEYDISAAPTVAFSNAGTATWALIALIGTKTTYVMGQVGVQGEGRDITVIDKNIVDATPMLFDKITVRY